MKYSALTVPYISNNQIGKIGQPSPTLILLSTHYSVVCTKLGGLNDVPTEVYKNYQSISIFVDLSDFCKLPS